MARSRQLYIDNFEVLYSDVFFDMVQIDPAYVPRFVPRTFNFQLHEVADGSLASLFEANTETGRAMRRRLFTDFRFFSGLFTQQILLLKSLGDSIMFTHWDAHGGNWLYKSVPFARVEASGKGTPVESYIVYTQGNQLGWAIPLSDVAGIVIKLHDFGMSYARVGNNILTLGFPGAFPTDDSKRYMFNSAYCPSFDLARMGYFYYYLLLAFVQDNGNSFEGVSDRVVSTLLELWPTSAKQDDMNVMYASHLRPEQAVAVISLRRQLESWSRTLNTAQPIGKLRADTIRRSHEYLQTANFVYYPFDDTRDPYPTQLLSTTQACSQFVSSYGAMPKAKKNQVEIIDMTLAPIVAADTIARLSVPAARMTFETGKSLDGENCSSVRQPVDEQLFPSATSHMLMLPLPEGYCRGLLEDAPTSTSLRCCCCCCAARVPAKLDVANSRTDAMQLERFAQAFKRGVQRVLADGTNNQDEPLVLAALASAKKTTTLKR